jgi:hypothetical protein
MTPEEFWEISQFWLPALYRSGEKFCSGGSSWEKPQKKTKKQKKFIVNLFNYQVI